MVTLDEKWNSRSTSSGENPWAELIYIVGETTSEVLVRSTVLSSTPPMFESLHRQGFQIKRIGQTEWIATLRYGRVKPTEQGDSVFQFDTAGGNQHISQSIKTRNTYGPGNDKAPQHNGAIGVNGDMIEGVDVTVPAFSWSERHFLATSWINDAYRDTLYWLTGRVNDSTYRGLPAGSCLFLGAAGSQRGSEDWEIAYKFACSPNATNLVIGNPNDPKKRIAGITKRGWDYLWVQYEDYEDTAAKRLGKKPVGAYVEQVYYEGDFGLLRI